MCIVERPGGFTGASINERTRRIESIKSYTSIIDEVYQRASVSSVLNPGPQSAMTFAAAETSRLLTWREAAMASWLEPPLSKARRICLFLDIGMPLSVTGAPYWALAPDSRAVP